MSHQERQLREELLANDDEFRRLNEEHRDTESRLEALQAKSGLSQEDEMEEKRLKLHKLSLKDRMELMLRERREEAGVTA